jgi:hypothetical protein
LKTNQKFKKPTIEEIKVLIGEDISNEIALQLLEQIEEFCLIIIEQNANG